MLLLGLPVGGDTARCGRFRGGFRLCVVTRVKRRCWRHCSTALSRVLRSRVAPGCAALLPADGAGPLALLPEGFTR